MTLHPADEAAFWAFVNERHAIYLKKAAGSPKPWTSDRILMRYKFTNVFRQLDTGTVWLLRNFIDPYDRDGNAGLLVGNIGIYRLFNWVGTGQLLGWQVDWNAASVRAKLKLARDAGSKIFTSAHLVWSRGGTSKIDAVVDRCSELWCKRESVAAAATRFGTKRAVFDVLIDIDGIGDFTAGEIISDLCYTSLLRSPDDMNTWLPVGPGARRGLCRIMPGLSRDEEVAGMVRLLLASKTKRARWVPALCLRDIAMALCEFDKYARVLYGEGAPKARYCGLP